MSPAVHVGRHGSISISPAAAPQWRSAAPRSATPQSAALEPLPASSPKQLSAYSTALLTENAAIAREIKDLHSALGDDLGERFAQG